MKHLNTIIQSHVIDGLRQLEDGCVNCCVTSPPYWGLRDYGIESQLGLEKTPEEYVQNMVEVFREVRRVLRNDGTLWLNVGDSYAAHSKKRTLEQAQGKSTLQGRKNGQNLTQINKITGIFKPKDLIGIPWMLAFALRADGWYLRQDIIWSKPNPMPESCNDRCTKAHEYIFLLSKSKRYYYDAYAIATPYKDKTLTTFGIKSTGHGDGTGLVASENWARDVKIRKPKVWKQPDGWDTGKGSHGSFHRNGREKGNKSNTSPNGRANKRSVWAVPTKPFKEAHFATFPEALVVDCIKAGCPGGGGFGSVYGGRDYSIGSSKVEQELHRN